MFQEPTILEKLDWNNTYKEGYYRVELITFLIALIILCVIGFLLIYYNFRQKNLSERWLLLRFLIIILIGIGIVLLFLFEVIRVWLSVESTNSNFIWTLLIALLLGIFVIIVGAQTAMSNSNKLILLAIVIAFFLLGFGLFGFLIYLNFPFLVYKYYESNTIRGVYFLTSNLYLLLIVYVVSFMAESEVVD